MTTKVCIQCKISKPSTEFRWKNKLRGSHNQRCKPCDKIYRAQYQKTHADILRASKARYIAKRRKKISSGSIKVPQVLTCIICGIKKSKNKFRWRYESLGIKVTRCKECDRIHRQKIYKQKSEKFIASRDRTRQKLRQITDGLRSKPCTDCKRKFPTYIMDFDHRDPSTKVDKVSSFVFKGSLPLLMAEIAKCDVVCANCHKIRTHKRKQEKLHAKRESRSC
jgi:Zn-finger protein